MRIKRENGLWKRVRERDWRKSGSMVECETGKPESRAAYPLRRGWTLQTKERRERQWRLHILTLFRLEFSLLPLLVCAIRSSGDENSRHYCNNDGWCCKALSICYLGKPCVSGFPFLNLTIAHGRTRVRTDVRSHKPTQPNKAPRRMKRFECWIVEGCHTKRCLWSWEHISYATFLAFLSSIDPRTPERYKIS